MKEKNLKKIFIYFFCLKKILSDLLEISTKSISFFLWEKERNLIFLSKEYQ